MLQVAFSEYPISDGLLKTELESYRNGGGYEYDQGAAAEEAITQSDYWTVINSFFQDKGLVRQQLESFNEFIDNSMQEIVDERSRLTLDQHEQYTGLKGDQTVGGGYRNAKLQIESRHSADMRSHLGKYI